MPPHAQFSPRAGIALLRFVNRDPEPRREMEMIQGRKRSRRRQRRRIQNRWRCRNLTRCFIGIGTGRSDGRDSRVNSLSRESDQHRHSSGDPNNSAHCGKASFHVHTVAKLRCSRVALATTLQADIWFCHFLIQGITNGLGSAVPKRARRELPRVTSP